jgi:2-oxoglutarate ferredoxin oxidoreductase subunit delta
MKQVKGSVDVWDCGQNQECRAMSEQKKSYEHIIRERWCKGCNICVAFCPKQVLALRNGKVYAAHPELCIGCRLCEIRCPDFAIEIHERGVDESDAVDASDMDHTVPPEARHA